MNATRTIPIVMSSPVAPVESGLIASLAHPGGNVTGIAGSLPGLQQKRLELLSDLVAPLSQLAVLWNPSETASRPIFTKPSTLRVC